MVGFRLILLLGASSLLIAAEPAVVPAAALAKKWQRTKSLADPKEETRATSVRVTKGLKVEIQQVAVRVDADTQEAFQNIQFELGSDMLQAGASCSQQLAEIAKAMRMAGTETFLVEGHTCDLGGELENKSLSQRRAQAIVAALCQLGVAEERLQPLGFGAEHPLTPNRTEAERCINRRVAIFRKL